MSVERPQSDVPCVYGPTSECSDMFVADTTEHKTLLKKSHTLDPKVNIEYPGGN